MKKSWFDIQAKAPGTPEIFIYDEIGGFGIRADRFIAELKALGDVQTMDVHINSPGGDPFAAAAIYLALKRHPATVNVFNDGLVASAASIVMMAGDKIVMARNTMLMIHDPVGGVIGTSEDLRDFADALDKIAQTILAAYRRSGKTDEELAAIMAAETWYTAEEALAAGFVDEISDEIRIAAFFDASRFENPPAALPRAAARQEPAPEPQPTPGPQLTGKQTEVVAKAEAIVRTAAEGELRAKAMSDAGAIVQACADAGHLELAAGFLTRSLSLEEVRAELARPENVSSASDATAAARVSGILQICAQAGVSDMAEGFISNGATIDAVRARFKHADAIRARCVAAGMPQRAERYIRANVDPEEVGNNLFEIKLAMEGPEIDGHIGPDGERQASAPKKFDSGAVYARYRAKELMSNNELYAMRNAGHDQSSKSKEARLVAAIKEALR